MLTIVQLSKLDRLFWVATIVPDVQSKFLGLESLFVRTRLSTSSVDDANVINSLMKFAAQNLSMESSVAKYA